MLRRLALSACVIVLTSAAIAAILTYREDIPFPTWEELLPYGLSLMPRLALIVGVILAVIAWVRAKPARWPWLSATLLVFLTLILFGPISGFHHMFNCGILAYMTVDCDSPPEDLPIPFGDCGIRGSALLLVITIAVWLSLVVMLTYFFRRRAAAGVLLLLMLVALPLAAADDLPYDIVAVEKGRIAVPKEWRDMDAFTGKALYRQGDGMGVIPPVDDTGEPLQIGMVIEKQDPTKESIEKIMDDVLAGAKGDSRLALVRKDITKIKLADGTDALLLRAEFLKSQTRRSYQMKLVAKDAASNVWIASAHLVGGKDSEWARPGSTMAKWLEAHLTSFTLDGKKFDKKKVDAAYRDE